MEAEQRSPEPKPSRGDRAERAERADKVEPVTERSTPAPRRRAVAAESREPAPVPPPEPPHETIRFAPDQRLNIAYNPNCTHEAGSRQSFVAEVLGKSEAGARAFCPRCEQQAMRFVRVNTALGLFGIGACERCGYWYLM